MTEWVVKTPNISLNTEDAVATSLMSSWENRHTLGQETWHPGHERDERYKKVRLQHTTHEVTLGWKQYHERPAIAERHFER